MVVLFGLVVFLVDMIYNIGDVVMVILFWVVFVLVCCKLLCCFIYGFGWVEDIVGIFIVLVILFFVIVVGW